MAAIKPPKHGGSVKAARTTNDLGAIVRAQRLAKGLTLAQLAARCGYSVSALSRMERGKQPLRDIKVLRGLAEALGIDPLVLGLADAWQGYPGIRPGGTMVEATQPPAKETDPMRRRTLLTGLTGVAGTAVFGAGPSFAEPDGPLTGLVDALLNPPQLTGAPPALDQLRERVAAAYATFHSGRYLEVATRLPELISGVLATRDEQDGYLEAAVANGRLAELYVLGSELMVKLCHDGLAWTAADRAVQAADLSGDAVTQAAARRAWAIVLRRAGRTDTAQRLVVDGAAALQPKLGRDVQHLSAYGSLLATAAYTAAVDGDRSTAGMLITEAAAAAEAAARLRTGGGGGLRTAFGPMRVDLYRVSIARVLGDSGTAIEVARRIDPAAIATAEQRARHWANVARAFHQWGKPEECYRALLAAERAAPDEVRYRKPIQRITLDLLRHRTAQRMSGLRAFAARTGIPG